jgi:hypothetical protein
MLINGCSLVYGGNSKMLFRVRSPFQFLTGNLRVEEQYLLLYIMQTSNPCLLYSWRLVLS